MNKLNVEYLIMYIEGRKMKISNSVNVCLKQLGVLMMVTLILAGCGGSDSKEKQGKLSKNGYIKFYNASKDSPAVFLTVDEDLNSSKSEEVEITFRPAEYTQAIDNYEIEPNEYFYELAWQDKDSSARDNLKMIHEGRFNVKEKVMQLVVLSDSIASPKVNLYDIARLDNTEDKEKKLFNIRILNMHAGAEGVDIYISKADETFNEAELIGQYTYTELSNNKKYDQGEYVFYMTKPGSSDVLFTSKEVDYQYPAQYVMVIRVNNSADTDSYALDKVSNASPVQAYLDADAVAKFRAYNAINTHDLLPNYEGKFDVAIRGVYENADISALAQGELSDMLTLGNGDYSIDITATDNTEPLLRNHLLGLSENTHKTFFFYLTEKSLDTDNDGTIDEVEVKVNSLDVNNSMRESIYDHTISMVNLVDEDEFSTIKFYFVKGNETIATTSLNKTVPYAKSESISLLNNTYQVFALADIDGSRVILSSFELVLDESSDEMFMVVEIDDNSVSGYRINMMEQSK